MRTECPQGVKKSTKGDFCPFETPEILAPPWRGKKSGGRGSTARDSGLPESSTKKATYKRGLKVQTFGDTKFMSFTELSNFIEVSRLDLELDESHLRFQLRDEPCPHFCGWCGLNAHAKGDCSHGN